MSVEIPVIDLSIFVNGNEAERLEIARSIGQACEDIGFLIIKNHCIDPQVIKDAWEITGTFFD